MSGQDVMMWLSMGSLHVLHERFTENDGELDVQQFCEIMMELCVMREEEDAVHKCRRLIDLFVQIDVNGDGSMEWDELSAFIIESGMAASSKAKIGLRLTYDAITSLVHNCRRKEVVQLEYIRSASSLETGLAPVPHPASGGAPPFLTRRAKAIAMATTLTTTTTTELRKKVRLLRRVTRSSIAAASSP